MAKNIWGHRPLAVTALSSVSHFVGQEWWGAPLEVIPGSTTQVEAGRGPTTVLI